MLTECFLPNVTRCYLHTFPSSNTSPKNSSHSLLFNFSFRVSLPYDVVGIMVVGLFKATEAVEEDKLKTDLRLRKFQQPYVLHFA